MQGMEAASLQNDFYTLYRRIRSFAPKTQRRRVQVRSVEGHVLGPNAEHDAIVKHFSDLYTDPSHTLQQLDGPCALHLEQASIAKGFAKLKLDTSVPPDCAPTAAWKAVSDVATPWLKDCADLAFNRQFSIPQLWSDCWLCLIPKPHKASKLPGDLRPLGIQEVTGKIVISSIRDQLRLLADGVITRFPQYAYLQGRGTDTAISRVATHCRLIREANKSERLSLYAHAAGMSRKKMLGGGQLKLDLTTAFDLVPRDKLSAALTWSGAGFEISNTIMAWHDQCRYHVKHGGKETLISMQKGVRQGCPLAPYLFSIFSSFLLQQLADIIGMDRVLACVTLFADDTHAKWAFQDPSSFITLLGDVQLIFSLFKANGMAANFSKSEFICVSRDPQIKRMIKGRLAKIKGTQYIDLGSPRNPILVKFVTEFEYLGIIASYKDFEFRSLLHRLSAADSNYKRLKRVLHSTRYISVRRRLIIYNACVRSSASYGLLAVGVTNTTLDRFCKQEIRHVRAIARSPRHLSHESSADLLKRIKQNTPVEFLLKIAKGKISNMCDDSQADLLECLRFSISSLERHAAGQGPQVVFAWQQVPCPTCGVHFDSVPSMRLHHARKHGVALGLQRKEYASLSKTLKMEDHMTNGLPICRHCGKKCARPQALKMHLLRTCPVFTAQRQQTVMTAHVPGSRQTVLQRDGHVSTNANARMCAQDEVRHLSQSGAHADTADAQANLEEEEGASKQADPHSVPSSHGNVCAAPAFAALPANDMPSQAPVSAAHRNAYQVSEAGTDKPVAQWDDVVNAWSGDWRKTLELEGVKKRLQNHCIFCGAFFVKGGLKSHLRRSRAMEYRHQATAEAVCRSSGKCTFSPCEGCGVVLKSASLRTHPARCEVLFQLRLACEAHLASNDGGGRKDGGNGGVASLFSLHESRTFTTVSGRAGFTAPKCGRQGSEGSKDSGGAEGQSVQPRASCRIKAGRGSKDRIGSRTSLK